MTCNRLLDFAQWVRGQLDDLQPQALQDFPHGAAFARMRALGVTHVFVHADQMPDGVLAAMDARADVERAGSFGAIVLYRLKPEP